MSERNIQLREGLIVRDIEDEALIFDPDSFDTHYLNRTAWWIWQQLEQQQCEEDIIRNMMDTFQLSRSDAAQHLLRFIEESEERNLLRRTRADIPSDSTVMHESIC